MKAYYQTDPGKVRSHNEDSVNIVKNRNDEYLVVVADGMGGHKNGEHDLLRNHCKRSSELLHQCERRNTLSILSEFQKRC